MKGKLVTYTVPTDFFVDPRELVAAGYRDYAPRNNFKGCFIAALRRVYKNRDRFYRKFNDNDYDVTFALFLEEHFDDDVDVKKQLVAKLNKHSGRIEFTTEGFEELRTKILEAYEYERSNYNGGQFRSLIKNLLKSCYAVSIKRGSSVFFIDKKYEVFQEKLKDLPNHFPQVQILLWDIGEDEGAVDVINEAVKRDISKDVEDIIKGIKKEIEDGNMTQKKMENKTEEISKVIEKAKAHAHNLMGEGKGILERLNILKDEVEEAEGKVEVLSFDFNAELAKIKVVK